MNDETERMKKKTLLLSYYAQNGNTNNNNNVDSNSVTTTGPSSNGTVKESTNLTRNPFDLNAPSFEPDLYLKKVIKVRQQFLCLK